MSKFFFCESCITAKTNSKKFQRQKNQFHHTNPNRNRNNRQTKQPKAGLFKFVFFSSLVDRTLRDYCYKIESILHAVFSTYCCHPCRLWSKKNQSRTRERCGANEKYGNWCRWHFKAIPKQFASKWKENENVTAVQSSGQWLVEIIMSSLRCFRFFSRFFLRICRDFQHNVILNYHRIRFFSQTIWKKVLALRTLGK